MLPNLKIISLFHFREFIILIIPIRFPRDSHTRVNYSHYSHSFLKRQSHVS